MSEEHAMREPRDISPHQTELATSLRIPFIASPYPDWRYVTAIVVNPGDRLWFGHIPTAAEVRMVASFADEYREHWYRDSYTQMMREKYPYDVDGGAVGRYLIKHKHGGWGYRRGTWRSGPTFVPEWDGEPLPLPAVLDRCHGWGRGEINSRWLEWKAAHPDVFGGSDE